MRRLLAIGVVLIVAAIISRIGRRSNKMEPSGERRFPRLQTLFLFGTLVPTWAVLIFVVAQTCSLNEQTSILQADYEARSRPYLAIEDIQRQENPDGSANATICIKNFGIIPATDVKPTEAEIDYTKIIPTTPVCFETEEGVTICGQDFVTGGKVTAERLSGKIHYPGRPSHIEFTMSERAYTDIVRHGEFTILLVYYSGDKFYAYWADVTLEDREWKITDENDAILEDGKWTITSETER